MLTVDNSEHIAPGVQDGCRSRTLACGRQNIMLNATRGFSVASEEGTSLTL